ncbi:MAG: cytochrome c biogenesis protein CcsA, partial [Proteobacteria bacterium]|nr:cytochrome c biogenesis protein CcsA [Pseudomonadota bacterium]
MWTFFHRLASPPHIYRLAAIFAPWLLFPGLVLVAYGTYSGLFVAPTDYQQGDAFRIIYVHVPAAYLSMMAYMIMAVGGGIGLIWRIKLAHTVGAAAAPLGAAFTLLALLTGSIWGRPMWGTWWEWGDPRL